MGAGPGAVSAREAEVLALLADQLTYAEIGSRLFISARTVETHVESMRRKLGAADRRELVRVATTLLPATATSAGRSRPSLPAPLSSFVGRARERAELASALESSRLVTAVGPGGVGKTRLALAVAVDAADGYVGGTWYVDLVPVVDPASVASAVASATGSTAWAARSPEESLVAMLGQERTLLVLDNGEHVVDALARLVERLLTDCPQLRVLVTSRTRLVLPYERAFDVPGLSAPDAVALFLERSGLSEPVDLPRIERVCASLGGIALAVELAAARLPSLGLDGLEAGLSNQLDLLVGGERLSARHRSLHEALLWSYRLLSPADQAVLRRVSVFASPFDPAAVRDVAGFAPVAGDEVPSALARLTDHSLIGIVADVDGTRYRALEPVRQFGSRELDAGEQRTARVAHLAWARATAAQLDDEDAEPESWCRRVDAVVDDLRAARDWSRADDAREAAVDPLATTIAHLAFRRGRLRDAQTAYERAADEATAAAVARGASADHRAAARTYELAAAVAKCRVLGEDSFRLDLAAATAYERSGAATDAARLLARAAEHAWRFAGMYAGDPPFGAAATALERASRLAGDEPRARAAVLAATVTRRAHDDGGAGDVRAQVLGSVEAAREVGDPILVSAALDALAVAHVRRGELAAAATAEVSRVAALRPLADDPPAALELKDALHTAVSFAMGAGDLRTSLELATEHRALVFAREERDLASEDLFVPAALAGQWDGVLELGAQYRSAWERSGRPRAAGRGTGSAALALVHGLLGDDGGRRAWLEVAQAILGGDAANARDTAYSRLFDALLMLDRDNPAGALARLRASTPDDLNKRLLQHWTSAVTAEAAVRAGDPGATELVVAAEKLTATNPVCSVLAARARALLDGSWSVLPSLADRFAELGCPYQQQLTIRLLQATGES